MVSSPHYDSFAPGPFAVGVRSLRAADTGRGRVFPCEVWYPADGASRSDRAGEIRDVAARPGPRPLVIFSHFSFGGRRTAVFLCTHLASHGYLVAAMDHSELVAPELRGRTDETAEQRATRAEAVMAARVPDVRFLLDYLLGGRAAELTDIGLDAGRVAVAGHSLGGWTALAAPEQETRLRAVVALAPGGSSRPVPGVIPAKLSFGWKRQIPVLILAGDCDVPIPLDGVQEIFERAPEPRRMFVLRRADHQHFADDVEASHEALRAMKLPGAAAWMAAAMMPASQLCPGDLAHRFACGLTLAHLDAVLRHSAPAAALLDSGAEAALAARGIDAYSWRP